MTTFYSKISGDGTSLNTRIPRYLRQRCGIEKGNYIRYELLNNNDLFMTVCKDADKVAVSPHTTTLFRALNNEWQSTNALVRKSGFGWKTTNAHLLYLLDKNKVERKDVRGKKKVHGTYWRLPWNV